MGPHDFDMAYCFVVPDAGRAQRGRQGQVTPRQRVASVGVSLGNAATSRAAPSG